MAFVVLLTGVGGIGGGIIGIQIGVSETRNSAKQDETLTDADQKIVVLRNVNVGVLVGGVTGIVVSLAVIAWSARRKDAGRDEEGTDA